MAVVFGVVHSAARVTRPYLLKPVFDHILFADQKTTDLAWPGGERVWKAATDAAHEGLRLGEPATSPGAAETFWWVLLLGLAVGIALPVAHFGQSYLVEYAMGRVLIDLQQDHCRKLLALPLSAHQEMQRGDTLTRTLSDANRAQAGLRIFFSKVLQSAIAVAMGLGALMLLSWQLTLLVLVVVPPIAALVALFSKRIQRGARSRQETLGQVTQRLLHILAGIKTIKVYRAQEGERKAFRGENERLFRRALRVSRYRFTLRGLVEAITHLSFLAIFTFAVWLVLGQGWGVTAGSLAAFVPIVLATQRHARELTKNWTQLQDALPSAARFFELLDSRLEDRDPPGAVALAGIRDGVRFRGVSFSYGREPVLQDVSFEIGVGETVALVGRTGAGKTTLADLLLGFREPDSGSVEIDGTDLRRFDRDSLHRHLSVVSQEPFLFDGSVRQNIQYGDPDADEQRFAAAVAAARVDEFVEGLPDAYDTAVGDAGVKLSGGQRQRITIARALLSDPDLLIFDEATSALDAHSERSVQEAIEALLRGRSVLVIAHRLSTIRGADRIVVLEDGRVAAVGSHETLLAEGGLYNELVALQGGASKSASS
jgi:subfamily B ATP-binding cassette protein MsbA